MGNEAKHRSAFALGRQIAKLRTRRGGGYTAKFYAERLRPEVQILGIRTLTLILTVFTGVSDPLKCMVDSAVKFAYSTYLKRPF